MNYIGSKHKLSGFIYNTITEVVGKDLSQAVFCDLFAGTGAVGKLFKPYVKIVIANDVEYYSYVLNKNYIGNTTAIEATEFIKKLNDVPESKGFIFQEYGASGSANRNYFSAQNAKKIDAARQLIKTWKEAAIINQKMYYFLLASLLESADKVANTASVYGAYLKKIKASAAKEIRIKPAVFVETNSKNRVFQQDANALIKDIKGDILYLDPPYNARQYGANYHLLNTIAKYDTFVPKGKTGLPDYYKSNYCKKTMVLESFTDLIENAQFKHIFLSYNNEGLLSKQDVETVMKKYGNYTLATTKYQRFKADKTANRNHKASSTFEYLHILEKK